MSQNVFLETFKMSENDFVRIQEWQKILQRWDSELIQEG